MLVKRLMRFWKVIVLDTLGVILMILAILTGWLPGPGGIPLFLIGLSLLAINHTWAQRYIDLLKEYADRLDDFIFVKNPTVQLAYDVIAPLVIVTGAWFIYNRNALWQLTLGIFMIFIGLTFLLGNRDRFKKITRRFKR